MHNVLSTCLISKKSSVRIPPEAAHFFEKGKWVVSGVVVLCCLTTFLISSGIHAVEPLYWDTSINRTLSIFF